MEESVHSAPATGRRWAEIQSSPSSMNPDRGRSPPDGQRRRRGADHQAVSDQATVLGALHAPPLNSTSPDGLVTASVSVDVVLIDVLANVSECPESRDRRLEHLNAT